MKCYLITSESVERHIAYIRETADPAGRIPARLIFFRFAILRPMNNRQHHDVPSIFMDFVYDDVGVLDQLVCPGV